MANVPISNLTTTWNNVNTTFTGFKLNVTDTDSSSSSLLMDLQVSGTTKFRVDKNGSIILNLRTDIGALPIVASGTYGLYYVPANVGISFVTGGTTLISLLRNTEPKLRYSGDLMSFGSGGDLTVGRDAGNIFAQRNGVNAQTFRMYNTYTDASNYERGKFEWGTNVLRIGTEKAGTGTARALEFQTDGVTRLSITAPGSYAAVHTTDFGFFAKSVFRSPVDGVLNLTNWAGNNFTRLNIGPATSSFPSLKRNSSTLEVRLADDSAFTNIQGKLTTEANAVAETVVATHTLTLYDAAGTAYKVLAVAA